MAEITLRVPLGRPLTYQEVDDNFRSVQELTLLAQQFALTAQEASTLADDAKKEAIAAKDEALTASGSAASDAQRAEDAADRAEAISGFDGLHNTLAGRNEPGAHDASAISYGEDSLSDILSELYGGIGVRPDIRFDFVNQGYLDPRIEFTRASKDWDSQGREYGNNEPVLTDEGLWTGPRRTNLLFQTREPWESPWLVTDSRHFHRRYTSEESPVKGAGIVSFGPSEGESSFLTAIRQQIITLSPGTYSLSCYMKSLNPNGLLERPTIRTAHNATSGSIGAAGSIVSYISGSGGAYAETTVTGSGVFGVTQIVQCEPVGDGWYFYHETFEVLEEAAVRLRIFPYDNVNAFTGDGETGILQTAIQLEEGKIATPYIPTEGSQVTVAPSFQSVPKQLKGDYTVFVDFTPIAPTNGSNVTGVLSIFKSSTNIIAITLFGESLRLTFYGQGTGQRSNTNFVYGQRYKIAITLRDGKVWFFINGEMILESHELTLGIVNDFDTLVLGNLRPISASNKGPTFFHSVSVFDKNLTDEQLQELTTL